MYDGKFALKQVLFFNFFFEILSFKCKIWPFSEPYLHNLSISAFSFLVHYFYTKKTATDRSCKIDPSL